MDEIFNLKVTSIQSSTINNYKSFLIVPDGSYERWEQSEEGDVKRDLFFSALRTTIISLNGVFEHLNDFVDCVEVEYGGSDNKSFVLRTNKEG